MRTVIVVGAMPVATSIGILPATSRVDDRVSIESFHQAACFEHRVGDVGDRFLGVR